MDLSEMQKRADRWASTFEIQFMIDMSVFEIYRILCTCIDGEKNFHHWKDHTDVHAISVETDWPVYL